MAQSTRSSAGNRLLRNVGEWAEPPRPRQWLLEGTFCRRCLSGLAAAGNTGKTTLRLAQLVSVAIGRELTGQRILGRSRYRVLVVALEDDIDEIERKIRALSILYDIPRDEFLDCFWILSANRWKIAKLSAEDGWHIVPGQDAGECAGRPARSMW